MKIVSFIFAPIFIFANLGCSTLTRTPANLEQRIGSRSIPENSRTQNTVTETAYSSFAIKENGIKITQVISSTYSDRTNGKYGLELDGVRTDGFNSADGQFIQNNKIVDLVSGRETNPAKSSKIIITKDWSNTSEFYKWRKDSLDGKANRKSVSLIFHNDSGEETRINFYECYPTKWVGPALNAKNSGHAIETIELSFENYELKSQVNHF